MREKAFSKYATSFLLSRIVQTLIRKIPKITTIGKRPVTKQQLYRRIAGFTEIQNEIKYLFTLFMKQNRRKTG